MQRSSAWYRIVDQRVKEQEASDVNASGVVPHEKVAVAGIALPHVARVLALTLSWQLPNVGLRLL